MSDLPICAKLRRSTIGNGLILANPDGPEAADIISALYEAGEEVLAGLNARIDGAPSDCVPIFDGIAELHDALARTSQTKKASQP